MCVCLHVCLTKYQSSCVCVCVCVCFFKASLRVRYSTRQGRSIRTTRYHRFFFYLMTGLSNTPIRSPNRLLIHSPKMASKKPAWVIRRLFYVAFFVCIVSKRGAYTLCVKYFDKRPGNVDWCGCLIWHFTPCRMALRTVRTRYAIAHPASLSDHFHFLSVHDTLLWGPEWGIMCILDSPIQTANAWFGKLRNVRRHFESKRCQNLLILNFLLTCYFICVTVFFLGGDNGTSATTRVF